MGLLGQWYDKARGLLKQPGAGLDATRGLLMGAVSDSVGFLPDAVADAMRPFGYDVPRDQVIGGSDWLASKLTSPTGSPAESAGRFVGGLLSPGPTELLQSAGLLKRAPAMQELTTYHGSPHRINNVDDANPYGRFDMSKIGTGEGAQAYGHGIYLAESPDVARSYANITPDAGLPTPRRFIGDQELSAGTPEYHAASLMDSGKSLAAVRKEVASWIKDADTWPDARKASPSEVAMLDGWKRTLATLNQAKSKADFRRADNGHFYTVDLPDEHIAKMLDWDAPLSEQPEVMRALKESEVVPFGGRSLGWANAPAGQWEKAAATWTGEQIYRDISEGLTTNAGAIPQWARRQAQGTDAQASALLRSLGIPGIKYFDGGSRAAGEGTRNFVIFDPDIAKILKRE